jgi:DNA end-binding protein Ku
MPRTTRKQHLRAVPEDGERTTRDIWKGSLTFGLVEIPVALVAAEKPSAKISLSFLDRRDFSPVGYRRYNKKTEKEVPWSEIVHGYEYEKGEYVVVNKKDLRHANPDLTQTIAIEQFVDAQEIDPIYFEKPYYLEPLKENSKAYALMRETLRRTGKVGVARVVVRTRESVGVVGVRGPALVLYLLRYAEEVRKPEELDRLGRGTRNATVSPKEIQMAERLVADMTGEWDPSQYKDEYAKDLMKVIHAKVDSGDVHEVDERDEPAPKRGRGEILDLMPLLKRSVEASRNGGRKKVTGPKRTTARKSHARRSA